MAKKKRLTGMDTPRATNLNKVTNQTWFNKKLIQEILDSGLGLGVSSFNGRVGAVIPLEGDYAPYYTRKVLTTRGDLMTYNTDVVRLPIGPSGHVLTSDGTDVTWAPPVGGGGSTFVSLTDTPNTMTVADAGLSPTVDAFGVALEYVAKANIAGNAGINFNVANATLPDHAVNLSQLQELSGGLTYKGAWSPSPVTGDAGWPFPDEGTLDPNDNGHFWIVDTDGFDKDDRPFSMGDWIVFNGQGDGSLGTSWGQFSFGAGSSTFVELTDTPNSYFGNAGKTMVVNGTESGLEYFATPLTGFVPYTGAVQALDMGSNLVKTSAAPGVNIDLTNKLYVDTAVGTRVPYTGASSLLDMGGLAVKTTHVPAVGVDLTNKLYVDTKFVPYTGANMVIDLNVQNIKSTFVPLVDADLINKKYFDDTIDNVADAFVPYTGATANLDLGAFNVTATQFIGDGSQLTNLTFLQLTDTPNAYTSPDIGKVLAVNGTFDGLELITPVTAFTQLSDTAAALGSAFQVATMDATGTQIIWTTPWIPPTTTKGDIIVFSGTVDQRLEVGPDDTFLIADSTDPLGIRWGILPDVGVSTFVELTDTPNTMVVGDAGKGLVVNATGTALEYKFLAALGGLASQSFLVKAATSANEAVNLSQLNFTSLTDTAATLGAPGTVATMNAGGDQVIWATIPAGVTDHTLLSNIGVKTHATLDTEVNINNAKVGITPQQASDITTNNAKVGITPQQSDDIIINNAKVGITSQQSSDIITNNAKVSNVDHPLVETAVPVGAVFTDDYVDTIAFAANILTLGRTGALPDLTQSLNTLWGNPASNGQVLSSTAAGVRSWIDVTVDGVKWVHPYINGTYPKNTMVRVDGWTMITNKTTSDYPAPTKDGDVETDLPDLMPSFVETNYTGVVYSGHVYTLTESGWITQVDIWVPDLTDTTNYRILIRDITDPDTPIVNIIEEPVLFENTWTSVAIDNVAFAAGRIIEIVLDAFDNANTTSISGDWTRAVNNNSVATDPGVGQWGTRNTEQSLRINITDADSAVRTAELLTFTAGTTITFVDSADPDKSMSWRVNADPVNQGTHISWEQVTYNGTGSSGEPDSGSLSTMTAIIPVASPTKYVISPDYRLSNNTPFATVTGILKLNGVDQIGAADDAFGVRMHFQPAYLSPDWDIVSTDGTGGSTGTPGTGGIPEAPVDTDFYVRGNTDWFLADLQRITDVGSVTTNNITANAFIGDGSQLTGLTDTAAPATQIMYGTGAGYTSDAAFTNVGGTINMAVLNVAGVGTFGDQVTIPILPTADEHAASKGYVDDNSVDFLNLGTWGGLWEGSTLSATRASLPINTWVNVGTFSGSGSLGESRLILRMGGNNTLKRVEAIFVARVNSTADDDMWIRTYNIDNESGYNWISKVRVIRDTLGDYYWQVQYNAATSPSYATYTIVVQTKRGFNQTTTALDSTTSTTVSFSSFEIDNALNVYYYPSVGYLNDGGISNPIAFGEGLTTGVFGVASANKTEVVLNAGYIDLNAYNAGSNLGYFRVEHDFSALHARFRSADGSVGSLSWFDTTNTFVMDSKFVVQQDPTVGTGVGNRDYNDNRYGLGGGTIGGSIADDQVAFGNGANAIEGNSSLTYDKATGKLRIGGVSTTDYFNFRTNQSSANGRAIFEIAALGTEDAALWIMPDTPASATMPGTFEVFNSNDNTSTLTKRFGMTSYDTYAQIWSSAKGGSDAGEEIRFTTLGRSGTSQLTINTTGIVEIFTSPTTSTGLGNRGYNDARYAPISVAGSVTAVNNGSGMNFTNITGSGTVTLGTPSSLSGSSTNAVTTSSHTHAITTGPVANTSVICSGADIITYVTGLGFAGGTVTSVVAGAGMTQTGTSTINPTLNVVGGNGIVSNANNIALGALTANWAGGSVYTITANDFILGSDKALKTRVEPLTGGLLDVRYVEFEYKTNLGRRRAGVIANEIVDKYPELVHKDDDGLLSVSYTDLLIKEVSGLKNEVISLKDENTALKKRLDTLEKLVNSML